MATHNGWPKFPLFPTDKGPIHEERTRELTGADAHVAQAEIGDAGNGVDPYGADLEEGREQLEDESAGEDIQPDEIREMSSEDEAEPEERELTAQPTDPTPPDPTDDG